jgi:hypothetical protein
MTTIDRILTGVAVIASLATTALAQKVTYDYQRGTDFSQLQTFSIKESPPADAAASLTTAYDSPIVRQNTNAAVAAQLEGRGMKRDDDHPDVYVTTRRTFQTDYVVYGSPGWGYGWGYYGYGPYYSEPLTVGTLTVDITNAQTGELLWRGVAERDAHPMSNPQHRLERISQEVNKMFKNYPTTTVATSGRGTPKPTGR